MEFTDALKNALAKKQAAQHPESKNPNEQKIAKKGNSTSPVAKPPKKVTGRGR